MEESSWFWLNLALLAYRLFWTVWCGRILSAWRFDERCHIGAHANSLRVFEWQTHFVMLCPGYSETMNQSAAKQTCFNNVLNTNLIREKSWSGTDEFFCGGEQRVTEWCWGRERMGGCRGMAAPGELLRGGTMLTLLVCDWTWSKRTRSSLEWEKRRLEGWLENDDWLWPPVRGWARRKHRKIKSFQPTLRT